MFPLARVMKAAAGLGKTHEAVTRIATSNAALIEVYVPTHRLADEFKRRILACNPTKRVSVIRGRTVQDENGVPMCRKADLAKVLSEAGVSVFPNLCLRAGPKQAPIQCTHYDDCAYIAQYRRAEVRIYSHAHLPLERNLLEDRLPSHVVIDEAFILQCTGTKTIPLATLIDTRLPAHAQSLCAEIAGGIASDPAQVLERLRGAIASGDYQRALTALEKATVAVTPAMAPEDISRHIAQAFPAPDLLVLLRALATDATHHRPLQSVTVDAVGRRLTVHYKKPITRFTPRPHRVGGSRPPSILILDASASRMLIEQFFPVAAFVELPVARKARVIQCHSTRCSTTSLVPERNQAPETRMRAKNRLRDIQRLIDTLAASGKTLLVVGPSAVVGNPRQSIPPLLTCPPGVEFAHFQALRGVDRWKDCDTIVLIGRNQPPTTAVENLARALFADDPLPLLLSGEWSEAPRPYRHGDGTKGVKVQIHADERVQAVLEQLRERESEQAIDRLRLIHNDGPKEVILLSNLPLEIEVHELRTWKELMAGGSRLEQAWKTMETGVLPLTGQWLADRFPMFWKTAESAQRDVARTMKRGQNSNKSPITHLSGLLAEYRGPGQRNWSKCLSRHDCLDETRRALTDLLGVSIHVRPASDRP